MRYTASLRNLSFMALVLALAAPVAFAQDDEAISVPLSDPSRPGWVKAGLIAGSIRVEAYDGQEILIRTSTEMEAVEKSEEKPRKDGLRRIPNTSRGMSVEEEDNRVKIGVESWNKAVDIEIRVPRKTSLKLSTINNGSIEVHGVEGELELGNTNGSVHAINVAGSVVAQTINGEVKVTLRSVTPGKAMSFSSLNGDIDVTFPAGIKANLRMRTDMGEILTDFDFDAVPTTRRSSEGGEGKGYRLKIEKEVQAKLNGGGPEVVFKNLHGDILIRKGS